LLLGPLGRPFGTVLDLSGAPPGPLKGLWGAQQTPKSRPRAAQERPRAAQEPPKSGQERPKSGQKRPKSAQEAPSSPKRLGALFLIDLGAPSGSILGAREPQKTAKSPVLSSKIKVFAVWRAGAENGRKKPQKEPQNDPPPGPKPA